MRRLVTAVLSGLLIVACDSKPFDPSTVSLDGTWILSSTTDLQPGPLGNVTNRCEMRNLPVILESTSTAGLWIGETQDGGTRQCEVNGNLGPVNPYNPHWFLRFTKTGGNVEVDLGGTEVLYTGRLESSGQISGEVTGQVDGRVGTWTGRRSGTR
jgi:hypothetical protein